MSSIASTSMEQTQRVLGQESSTPIAGERSESPLPLEMIVKIFGFLDFGDLENTRVTCRDWEILSDEVIQKKFRDLGFGENKWKTYFGPVDSLSLTIEKILMIVKILACPCPFWPDKKVHETHMLTFIPSAVDKQPLTLEFLGELIKMPKNNGHKTQYDYLNPDIKIKPDKSHWALMTKDVIPNSRNKTYEDQKKLMSQYKRHELPQALDAAVSIFMEYVDTRKRLYNDNPFTYTRCQETVDQWPVAIGGFAAGGLYVSSSWDDDSCGVAGCRKFS